MIESPFSGQLRSLCGRRHQRTRGRVPNSQSSTCIHLALDEAIEEPGPAILLDAPANRPRGGGVPLRTERCSSDLLASLPVPPSGSRLQAGKRPQRRAVGVIQILRQELEKDLSERDSPRLLRHIEAPPLDDGQPKEQAAL